VTELSHLCGFQEPSRAREVVKYLQRCPRTLWKGSEQQKLKGAKPGRTAEKARDGDKSRQHKGKRKRRLLGAGKGRGNLKEMTILGPRTFSKPGQCQEDPDRVVTPVVCAQGC
jgi:hypothetical protein